MGDQTIVAVQGLRVRLPGGTVDTVRGIDLEARAGTLVGIAGEPGAGATTLLRALIGLLPDATVTGSVRLLGREMVDAPERDWREVRGREVAIVFRDPTIALDPTLRIGPQVAEGVEARGRVGRRERQERTAELLEEVGLEPAAAAGFAHQLSVGDGRRAMLAAALAGQPSLLLVDDGPASLSPEEHRSFLSDVARISAKRGMAGVIVGHQPALLAPFVDEIAVLCGGLIIEKAPPALLLASHRVPYTEALLRGRHLEPAESPTAPARPLTPPSRKISLFTTPPRARPRRPPAPPKPTLNEHLFVGCSYSLRCPRATVECAECEPPPAGDHTGHLWACWNPDPERGSAPRPPG